MTEQKEAVAMHLHTYRDKSHSRHFNLSGGSSHLWTIDLVTVTGEAVLAVGLAGALVALWVH
ncbi:hypothetical protein [Bradyrhizobium sp. CER78]|uniref:hypothetical protein n=1 Tax=Bradyrhizobium sp. CER78 TaxID=3039162 RepID=UPI0024471E36|nr:hypothetical protein [Bradyrhizobium sp. CER78]MDH2385020.1 hypothetical protein [Bradyrhizobium sp. CER78]